MREICREVKKRWQQKSGYGGITVDWKTRRKKKIWLSFVLTMAREAFHSIMSP
ncbi:hypothetical protein BS17DRAFT_777857 [Gyrodon lividus]|nr:hypothetical protein BS17DRAFT_777857 [Gyrodon lividus]